MQAQHYNKEEWLKYASKIYLALRGELSEFERDFLSSCYKQLGQLSMKQTNLLNKILVGIFK